MAGPTSTSPASSRTRSSPTSSTPASRSSASAAGQEVGGDGRVDQQRLGRVADPGPLRLRVDDDPPRHLQIGIGVDVDVAVAGGGVDHRHRRHVLQRLLQPFAAARDQQVDDAVLRRQLRQVAVPLADRQQQHRVLRQPGLGKRLARHRRQRRVRALRVVRAAQDDRVAALDRQRRAIDRHVRPRLVDDGDDAERHPQLAQVEPAVERLPFKLLADRILERSHGPDAVGHRRDPLLGQRQPVPQRLRQPRGPLVGRDRPHWPRGSPRLRSPSSRAVASSAASLAAVEALASSRAARRAARQLSATDLVVVAMRLRVARGAGALVPRPLSESSAARAVWEGAPDSLRPDTNRSR